MADIDIEEIRENLKIATTPDGGLGSWFPVPFKSIESSLNDLRYLVDDYERVVADRDQLREALFAVASDVHLDALANTPLMQPASTRTAPTKPGWYWFKGKIDKWSHDTMIRARLFKEDADKLRFQINGSGDPLRREIFDGQWSPVAGPLRWEEETDGDDALVRPDPGTGRREEVSEITDQDIIGIDPR